MMPEDTVKAKNRVKDEYADLFAAQESADKYMQQDIARQAATASTKPKLQGASTALQGLGSLGMLQAAATKSTQQGAAAEARKDKTLLGAAGLEQEIAKQRSHQSLRNLQYGLEDETNKMARAVSQRLFDAGYSAKELVFSRNEALADMALEKLKEDFYKGLVTEREVRDLAAKFALSAERKKQEFSAVLAKLQGELETALLQKDIEAAKIRLDNYYAVMEAIAADAAKAAMIASILQGGLSVAGTFMSTK